MVVQTDGTNAMPKSVEQLDATTVRQVKRPGRYHDGYGLYLEVDDGGKRWVLRLSIAGKRTTVGLGPLSEVSLAEAREQALERRKAAKAGDTSKTHQRAPRGKPDTPEGMTFKQAFHKHFEDHIRATLDPDYAPSYIGAVEALLMPSIGNKNVAEIQPEQIIEALRGPWANTPTRARKVAQRAFLAFQWAIANGLRRDPDPVKPARVVLGNKRPKAKHRPSIPWEEAPAFLVWLRERPMAHPSTVLCLEMILATALRSREARLARWHEIDFVAREWNVPGHDEVEAKARGFLKKRMKTGLAQVIPLSPLALDILERAQARRASKDPQALVFPAPAGGALSDNTLSKIMRDAGIKGTPHGLRATLRTWCLEHGVADDVAEKLLSHGEPDLTLAAYKRSTHFDARREALNRWSDFLLAGPSAKSSTK